MRYTRLAASCLAVLALAACESPPSAPDVEAPVALAQGGGDLAAMMNAMNAELAAGGFDVQVAYAEYITDPGTGELGQTVFANDRGNKQLSADFVPGDPRRSGLNNITYATDLVDGAASFPGLSAAQTAAAIDAAMATWEAASCSHLPLTDLGDFPIDLGFVQWLLGFGGVPGWLADVTHAGWLPGAFYDALVPGGSGFILGVTFTFVWTAVPDMDGNGKADVAFREIYYNDAFPWQVGGGHIDVETVALHEAGHGLSQAHFGKIFVTNKNGKAHFAPRAVMNAAYSGVQRELTGTDNAGHCSNWGSWPNS